MSPAFHPSRTFSVLAVVWIVAMTWHIYPQFKEAIRIDGRVMAVEDYVAETCAQRVGPAAATCLAETYETARQLLRREQAKSILLIEAPVLGYLSIYLPLRLLVGALIGHRASGAAPATKWL